MFVWLFRLKEENFRIWKLFLFGLLLQPKNYQASTERQQPVALPHHAPNSGLAKTNKALE
jgi:hypothetical protein